MSIIIGHTNSIKVMMEENRSCKDILVQISAVESSLNKLGKIILKNHTEISINKACQCEDELTRKNILNDINELFIKYVK